MKYEGKIYGKIAGRYIQLHPDKSDAARIAELEAALGKWIEAFETNWPIGSVPVYEATKEVLKNG